MGCGCKGQKGSTATSSRVAYEVHGGKAQSTETFPTIDEARTRAGELGARVRSVVVREPSAR